MEKIIATIVGIILVLGLIAYAILGQVAGVKDTGDKAAIEQQKISRMLQNPGIVTGNKVKDYYAQLGKDHISIGTIDAEESDFNDESFSYASTVDMDIDAVKDGALFEMKKKYNENGELSKVAFKQVDLSK
ncbi:MAG: hypothetical protein MJB12_14810 [Firmicutes bacterium]|nr:hypothetical protein [Bacillota bacterium]